ncbi:MAG: YqaE/Pmp3 family membrane protein [Phycisphaerales bacterium]
MEKILLIILAFFLPPLAVGLQTGLSGTLVLNIILTILFWLPGFIHALLVVL